VRKGILIHELVFNTNKDGEEFDEKGVFEEWMKKKNRYFIR